MGNVTKNITLGEDGVYRWVYELNLYTNPTIFFLLLKICGGVGLGLWGLLLLLAAVEGNFVREFSDITKVSILFTLGFFALILVGYLVYGLIMGGKYCVLFAMDEAGVNHISS